jgi:hypothetical protein
MQKELLEQIRTNRKRYEETIINSIQDYIYNYDRYKANFTMAIGAACNNVDLESFSSMIRPTDKFIILDEQLCCVIFPFTDAEQGIKAASNLLSKFESQFFSEKIYLGVVNAEECSTPEGLISRLFDILKSSIENGMENMPLDHISF